MNYPEILYEDNHIIVAVKPIGVLSQSDITEDPDMLTLLKEYIKEKYNKPGNVFLGLVHRLDRSVGGVMVFARTSKAASRLSDSIRKKEISKKYYAVVKGSPKHSEDVLKSYLLKDSKTNTVKSVSKNTSGAKEAILSYEVCQKVNGCSLVKVDLQTGRPHQIRVQFAEIGCPLLGDAKYGDKIKGRSFPALWSFSLKFIHPVKKELMIIERLPLQEEPWTRFKIF